MSRGGLERLRLASRRRFKDWLRLHGRLLPVKEATNTEDSDTDDDGDQHEGLDPEFLDADEIEGGAIQVTSWAPQKSKVKIVTHDNKEYIVNGFFLLEDPWWLVTVDVVKSGSLCFAKGPPSYELRDEMLGVGSNLPLFLMKCGVPDGHKQSFTAWLQRYPTICFSTLKERAALFCAESQINILPYLESSNSGSFELKALDIPLVLKYIPKLLPHKMKSLLMIDSHDKNNRPDNILDILENMLATDPWKLGFSKMVYDELHLCCCEATWNNFLQCDCLLEKIPDLQRNALIVYNELKRKCAELGDTYVEVQELTKSVSRNMSAVDAWDAIKFLKDNEIVVVELQRVFVYSMYYYEVDIADFINKIVHRKSSNMDNDKNYVFGNTQSPEEKQTTADADPNAANEDDSTSTEQLKEGNLPDNEATYSTKLDVEQQKAMKMILDNPVTVISGKGGCGKTTVVSHVFRSMMRRENDEVKDACLAFESDINASDEWTCDAVTSKFVESGDICTLLTAPTGKAASLLKKKTGLHAATLHQVTCSYSAWRNHVADEEKPWKFSKVESLVVDEGSLVSVRIFSAVLKLLYEHARLSKLVILGDVRQLPSIEPGNMLADIFSALNKMNWTIELKTNHRAESQLIVDNATLISHQSSVDFDAVVHIDGTTCTNMPSEDKKFILVSLSGSDCDLHTAIQALLQEGPGLQDHVHSQFIAFRRKECLLINELCCKHYSAHTIKNHKNRFEFRCGDKVCCTKNAYVKDLMSKSRHSSSSNGTDNFSQTQPERLLSGIDNADRNTQGQSKKELNDNDRICNGEIFFITDDVERDKVRDLTLFDGEDRTYTLNYKALRSRSGLQHAWARTIHTFQGSEEDTVVYVLGAAGRQNWKHVYTAVTRGCKRVYIIAKRCQLDKAISTRARERKTRLQQHLKNVLNQNRSSSPPCTQGIWESEPTYTRIKLPPESTTPKAGNDPYFDEEAEFTDHTLAYETSQQCDGATFTKRSAVPGASCETPTKISRVGTLMDMDETSPTRGTNLQNLSLHSPTVKNNLSTPKR